MFLISDAFWKIKKTKEKGFGVFAKKDIRAGTIIGDYLGQIVETREYDLEKDKKGLFLMYFTDDACIYPSLKKPGIHLVNHSCQPNCWIYTHKGHTLFFALRKIKPKEELTISYLLSPLDQTCDPCTHPCQCKSNFCTGTMHLTRYKYDKWQKFLRSINKTKTPKLVFGKNLKKLKSYPKIDYQNPIYKQMQATI